MGCSPESDARVIRYHVNPLCLEAIVHEGHSLCGSRYSDE